MQRNRLCGKGSRTAHFSYFCATFRTRALRGLMHLARWALDALGEGLCAWGRSGRRGDLGARASRLSWARGHCGRVGRFESKAASGEIAASDLTLHERGPSAGDSKKLLARCDARGRCTWEWGSGSELKALMTIGVHNVLRSRIAGAGLRVFGTLNCGQRFPCCVRGDTRQFKQR